MDYKYQLNQSYTKGVTEKENTEPLKTRPKTAQYLFGSTAADSRYAMDQQRYSQYASRYTPGHESMTRYVRPTISSHQDYFITELTAEVNELRSRQRDYAKLQEQYKHLQQQYSNQQFDKQQFESQCLQKIAQDRQEVDLLIREVDKLKQDNQFCEDEQMRLLDSIGATEREVANASG